MLAVAGIAALSTAVLAGCSSETPSARLPIQESVLPSPHLSTSAVTQADERPNILMITSDDLSIHDLKYMPHVRRLLTDEGVTFTDALSPTPLCVPARASLLSGEYAHNDRAHSISGPNGGYSSFDEQDDIAVALQKAGYDTLFTGKFLNGYGEHGTARQVPPGWTDWRATVDPSTYNYNAPVVNDNGTLKAYHAYTTDVMSAEANEMLTQPQRLQKPWFMWLSYVAPHAGSAEEPGERPGPHTMRAKAKRLYDRYRADGKPMPTNVRDTIIEHYFTSPVPTTADAEKVGTLPLPNLPDMFQRRYKGLPARSPIGTLPDTSLVRYAAQYEYDRRVAAAQSVDRAVASQIAILRHTGQLSHTLIIFGSDNGFVTGEHSINGKLWGYNEITRIPLLMRGPGVPKHKVVHTAITNPDIAATILAAAKATPLLPLDGQDMLPWLDRPTRDRVTEIEAWPVVASPTHDRRLYSGIRVGPWTYIRYSGGGEELYDRATDPYELHTLVDVKADRWQLRELRLLDSLYEDCVGNGCHSPFYKPGHDPVSVAARTHRLVRPPQA